MNNLRDRLAEEIVTLGYQKVEPHQIVIDKDEYERLNSTVNVIKVKKEVAQEIYNQLQGHGTTYVKKWINERFGLGIKTDKHADVCQYYDADNMRCNGARFKPECYCDGFISKCTEYPENRRNHDQQDD